MALAQSPQREFGNYFWGQTVADEFVELIGLQLLLPRQCRTAGCFDVTA